MMSVKPDGIINAGKYDQVLIHHAADAACVHVQRDKEGETRRATETNTVS